MTIYRYYIYVMAAWWKRTQEVFRISELLSPTIKFTANYSRKEINFLDFSVWKKNNQLVIDLHRKPTDTHQYLHASSCHFITLKNPYFTVRHYA